MKKVYIKHKFIILFVLIYVGVVGLIFSFSKLYYSQIYENEIALTSANSEQQTHHTKKKILTTLDSIISEVLLVSEDSSVIDFIDDQSEVNEKALIDEFLTLVRYRNIYDQVRFISLDGKERVRVNYNYGKLEVVVTERLQDKSDSPYFNDLSVLEQNEIYVSKFELNVERGVIETPHKPVIRVGVPVYSNDKKKGFLVFNYLAEELLYSLSEVSLGDSVSLLYNSDGYLLKGIKPEEEWGFVFDDRASHTLKRTDPELWAEIESINNDSILNEKGLYVVSTINPLENIVAKAHCTCKFWKLVSFTPTSVLRSDSIAVMYYLLIINFSIMVALGVILWVVIRFILYRQKTDREILELNDTLKVINKILRHDLANAFTSIGLTLDSYEDEIKKIESGKEYVKITREVVDGGKNLIHHMKELEGMVSLGEEMKSRKVHEIISNVIKKYRIKINLKGRARIYCDEAILTVFDNIISNAMRHGRTKKMDINIRRSKKGVKIEFVDYGKTIPFEITKKVFDEGFKYGKTGNTGLGLYIVKKTIARYGGNVFIKNNKPKGNKFILFFPK